MTSLVLYTTRVKRAPTRQAYVLSYNDASRLKNAAGGSSAAEHCLPCRDTSDDQDVSGSQARIQASRAVRCAFACCEHSVESCQGFHEWPPENAEVVCLEFM